MKRLRKTIPLAFLAFVLVIQLLMSSMAFPGMVPSSPSKNSESSNELRYYEDDDGTRIPLGPGEEIHKFVISTQGTTEWSGTSDYLPAAEYGNRSDLFTSQNMYYYSDGTIINKSVAIPTGADWEAYYVDAEISDLTENRTWMTNPDFTNNANGWTLGSVGNNSGYSNTFAEWLQNTTAPDYSCLHFEIRSSSTSAPYFYDDGDASYALQTVTVPRGDVVWAGLRLDYWADTTDDTHYGMTGSFMIYANIEGTRVWNMVFGDIGAEETWFDSGLMTIQDSIFNLPTDQSVSLEVGLLSTATVGYDPEIGPHARVDNIVLYLKTRATPSSVNLQMNGLDVTDGTGYGTGTINETPSTPWSVNPVLLNFTWAPTPATPDPNKDITIELDVSTNIFARRTTAQTVYEISPASYGERFTIQNGTLANYSTYFYANIPDGYPNRYFFNLTLPATRDVFFVAKPLAPSTNLTSGWTGGDIGNGYLNVSAYDVATEAGRYGYWRIQSQSANMITDILMLDPATSTWKRFVDIRAGNSTKISVYVGAAYANSIVNVTIYDPSGAAWDSVSATVNSTGYATTGSFNFAGLNASAGSWMIEAVTNDRGTTGIWRNTGFFKRAFTVTHVSDITIDYPNDAVGTWMTNVTYGDLLLVVINATDLDSSIMVPGGALEYTWALGSSTFDDSGNGQYTKVFDTGNLPGKGQYVMSLNWYHPNFDNSTAQLVINVNYATELTSPDYPGIQGPVGASQSFLVNFTNVNGTGILNALVICNWSQSYTVMEQGGGIYRIDLNTTGMVISEYPVQITASAPFVETNTMLMYVEIREIYNTVSYSANQLSIPVGEAASFTITWTDSDTGNPITGGASYITCNWTSFHSFGEQNYTISEIAPGEYNVTIYTQSDDPLTAPNEYYTVQFNVSRKNYQNHTFYIDIQIRSHNTLFILDEPVEQTLYGDPIVVLVYYEDTDLSEGIGNSTGFVSITVTSPGVPSLSYSTSVSSFGTGHYNITIPSGQWGSIGWKNLTIFIEWTGSVNKYYSKTINTSVRVLGTETDLFLELAPTATIYLNDFTFSVVYYDSINATRISNSSFNVFYTITPLSAGHPVTQSDFVMIESISNPGTYEFSLNSSKFGAIGSFQFEIAFMWSAGVQPFYENQTMTITLVVLERPTYIDYSPVQATPYGEIAEFMFSYIDSLTTSIIANSTQLSIGINEDGIIYTILYNASTKAFTLLINTSSLGGIGTFTLHLNVTWIGEPFYSAVSSQSFNVKVTLRSTQLSHKSFASPQWGNNVTIEFVYTDLVSGSTIGMTGTLTLDAFLSGWYTVTYLGDGNYLVEIDTHGFASDGQYSLNATIVYTGSNYAADATNLFDIIVQKRSTQFGYDTPDTTPFAENVTFIVNYVDDTTGQGIEGASITVSCSTSNEALILNVNYWFTDLASGQYEIKVNSTALGTVNLFVLNVTASKSGAPYYQPASIYVSARVSQRTTQILITQTPGDVPFLENVTFKFKFEDYLTGSLIPINKSHITLTHGNGMDIITSQNYALYNYGTYYEISFSSTIINPLALEVGHEIQILINKSLGVPFYAPRNSSTSVTTVERPTQILFPSIDPTPFGDNITINLEYIDYLTSAGVDGATLTVEIANSTSPTYYVFDLSNGEYQVLIPSQQFSGTGVILLNITLSRTGAPFYSTRQTTDVPATIREIQTSLLSEAPAAGTVPVGDPLTVNLTLTDFDHSLPIEGAIVTTNWFELYGTNIEVQELNGGQYQLIINTTGLIAQSYEFSIQASKVNYQTSNISITIQPGSPTVEIVLEKTTYYADWGQILTIRFAVQESLKNTTLAGMNATLLWNGTLYSFTDNGDGTYMLDLDTSDMDVGTFEPQITVSRELYQTRYKSFILIVSKSSAQIVPESTQYNVVLETSLTFTVYLNDTARNLPVLDATVSFEWNNTPYSMTNNGTPGFYTGLIDVSGFAIGDYPIEINAFATNFQLFKITIDLRVVPIPSSLGGEQLPNQLTAYFGDILNMTIVYNDTYYGGLISGANITYTIGNLTGVFDEISNGTYNAIIDTSPLVTGTYYLRLTASRANYSTVHKNVLLNLLPIPTDVDVLGIPTLEGYPEQNVSVIVQYVNTRNNNTIAGAAVTVSWEGGTGYVEDLGDGRYNITINLGNQLPRLYDVKIQLYKSNYLLGSEQVQVIIKRTPASITGPSSASVPINDTATFVFTVYNDLNGEIIHDINGLVYWDLGPEPLTPLENGSYSFTIPDDLPINTYDIEVAFTTSMYQISSFTMNLEIRDIHTSLLYENNTIVTTPGSTIEVRITYYDIDHSLGISGAVVNVQYSSENLTYFADLTTEENGTYRFVFQIHAVRTFSLTISFAKEHYQTQIVVLHIYSDISAEQVLAQQSMMWGGIALFAIAALIAAYVRYFSVPKLIRAMNALIAALRKGKVPRPYPAKSRAQLLQEITNKELEPIGIVKTLDEITGETVEAIVPEVNQLLDRLAEITGLGPEEIDAFRADLARMKPSERPGFLMEVIAQEEARRAEALAEGEPQEPIRETLGERPDELEELRLRLEKKGLGEDEIEIILEQAQNLSKADLEALLSSLGIDID